MPADQHSYVGRDSQLRNGYPNELTDGGAGEFRSILFPETDESAFQPVPSEPGFFHDLNLDQAVASITAAWREYDLTPFFWQPLQRVDTIVYRQEIMRDLESSTVAQAISAFSRDMRQMRKTLPQAEKYYFAYERERQFLSAVQVYLRAVTTLARDLAEIELCSNGMRSFADYLSTYVASSQFMTLASHAEVIDSALCSIRYYLYIHGSSVTVRLYEDDRDYSEAVETTFQKFRQGVVKDYYVKDREMTGMNHVQEQILVRLACYFPEPFEALVSFANQNTDFLDQKTSRFDREIQFYIAYLAHIRKLQDVGLPFCYPRFDDVSKETEASNAFDLALAEKLLANNTSLVLNDFSLKGAERIIVISGPNHGGKTTYARMIGQIHYLGALGCPVPGTRARLFLFDRLFTHFERQERIETLRGKLQDDLVRVHTILEQATPRSLVIMNEIFSSTMLQDAVFLGREVITRLSALDLLCVCVTFLDELSVLNEKTVSMVATVDPDNHAVRTYRLERKPADGLAYALAIAEKHHVTYQWLTRRISS